MGVILPNHLLERMSAQDREEISRAAGHPNAGLTANEARDKAMQRSEKEAQREISQFLRISGIEFICPPMNKRSILPEGWPDATFARNGVPIALEVKVWGQKPRPEQNARHDAMRRNGWRVYVVSGAADVKDIFRRMDAEYTINPLTGAPAPSEQQGGRR